MILSRHECFLSATSYCDLILTYKSHNEYSFGVMNFPDSVQCRKINIAHLYHIDLYGNIFYAYNDK